MEAEDGGEGSEGFGQGGGGGGGVWGGHLGHQMGLLRGGTFPVTPSANILKSTDNRVFIWYRSMSTDFSRISGRF